MREVPSPFRALGVAVLAVVILALFVAYVAQRLGLQ